MLKRLLFFTAIVTIFSSIALYSADFPYKGTVLDRAGKPVENATVSVKGGSATTTTDANGKFGIVTATLNSGFKSASGLLLQNRSLFISKLTPASNFSVNLVDLRGRQIISKVVRTDALGNAKADILPKSNNLSNGVYIVSIKTNSRSYNFKTTLNSNIFSSSKISLISNFSQTALISREKRATDTLEVTHTGYQTVDIVATSSSNEYEIILDPSGPDDIPVLFPDVSGKLYIRNSSGVITDTLKCFSVMPPAGIQEWDESVDGVAPTGVDYDATLTTSTTMKASMIRAKMQNSEDWQLSFATAKIGKTPFKNLSHIVIRYMVETNLDSIALSVNAVDNSGKVIGESADHGAFRCVLKKGVANPGKFVTDTLSLSDFTIGWVYQADISEGAALSNNLDSLDNYEAICFTNELLPWHDGASEPVNNGDTIKITVAGILFGTTDIPIDTTTDTTATYDVHRNITASTFWVGEGASSDNDFITNTESAWDEDWGKNFGLEDKPLMDRDAEFIPTSSSFTGDENPYYIAIPYNDMGPGVYDGAGATDNSAAIDSYERKTNAYTKVYWADEMSNSEWGSRNSMIKNRWVRLKVSGSDKYCYAQVEDSGPYYYNDVDYVFGKDRPANTTDAPYAAIDLAPSVCLYLDQTLEDWGAPSFEVDWNFVDENDVPSGPWKNHVTTRQINWH